MHPSIFFLFCFFVFFFSRLPFSPVAFFPPGESLFFSVESTPENSRRHLVAELLITASLRASNPASLFLRFFFFFFLCLFFFFFFFLYSPASNFDVRMYVRTYGSCNRRIPRARLLSTNERNAAVCMVSPGERRRVATHRAAGTGGMGGGSGRNVGRVTGLHRRGNAAAHTLEDHPARHYEITFVRQRLRPLSGMRGGERGDRIEFNPESCSG